MDGWELAGAADGTAGTPSDADPRIAAFGDGDVAAAVVSLSSRHPDGHDADYLRWHLLDHLPEQYRLGGLRLGQRWVSTPPCRAARAASSAPYDAVDHVVQYLFAEPVDGALANFFPLGAALGGIGRMPMRLPRVAVGGWDLVATAVADRVRVGAAVVPWRPAAGAYLMVERVDPSATTTESGPGPLVRAPGVFGAWQYGGTEPRHPRMESTTGLVLTVCYLDAPPVEVAGEMETVLARRWAGGSVAPLLAGPFERVVAGEWDRYLP
jgi:hypothetical protein